APVQMAEFASGTLTAALPVFASSLTVNQPQVLHLVFDLSQNPALTTAGARVTIVDSEGAVVYSQFVLAGDVASVNLFLRPGVYGVLIGGGTLDGSAFAGLQFALLGISLSDPIGPQPVDTTTQTSGGTTTTTGTTIQPTDWTVLGTYSPVPSADPISP